MIMKKGLKRIGLLLSAGFMFSCAVHPQESGLKCIDIPDLQNYMSVLASDDMEGRATGKPGLDRAADYIAANARKIGLKAIDDNGDYFQEYTLVTREMDQANSSITVSRGRKTGNPLNYPFYLLNPDSDHMEISGNVVFAGYGIYSREDDYDDFEGVDLTDKIVLILNRGPMDEAGNKNLLANRNWMELRSFRYKIPGLSMRMPKAVLIVQDPKSGYRSLEEASSGMARYLGRSRYVKELEDGQNRYMPEIRTKIIFIHRDVAEEILKPTGNSLAGLQDSIDSHLRPVSFEIPRVNVDIKATYRIDEKKVPNIAGLIEGSDPELKKEVIVYTAHFDHLGTAENGGVYNGADDNASGTVALLEIGQAFVAEQKNLKRSVLILWVSGEEIGLFGSEYYSEHPLIPLENTVADLNLDMIGAVRTERDRGMIHGERVSVLGMDSIGIIGGQQSSDLVQIHYEMADRMGMHTDTSLNDPDHPYQYYYRSDHINFARHNIPVLFYSTGVHVDYHKVTDNYYRINITKLRKVSDLCFLVGYELATRQQRIVVDNPFSSWGRMTR
jgi:hypothetical protein